MGATLAELAALVDGQLLGPGDLFIRGAAPLADVTPDQITLIDSEANLRSLAESPAAAVLVPCSIMPEGTPAIRVTDVHRAFATIITHFRPVRLQRRIGVSPMACVGTTVALGEDVDIHPFATVGDDVTIGARSTIHSGVSILSGSRIGEDVTIFPNAVLYENTVIGSRSIIHAGAILGAYGFGYEQVEGRHRLSAQLGNVELGESVEVGAGSTIDRGTYGPTVIGEGTKIDDQVMIAHNCHIGRHNMLCSQVGIAGSTSTGDYVVLAGQVGIRDHVHIGRGAVVGAKAGVSNDVPENCRMLGTPATFERNQKVIFAAIAKLPEMRHDFKKLLRTVEDLVARHTAHDAASPEPDRHAA